MDDGVLALSGSLLRWLTSASLASVVLLAGCSSSTEPSPSRQLAGGTPWSSTVPFRPATRADSHVVLKALLHRALRKPKPTGGCSPTVTHKAARVYGNVQGRGPVYPVSPGRLKVPFPNPARSIWGRSDFSGSKVRWIAGRQYAGPVLVRGFALRGNDPVKFNSHLKNYLFSPGYSPSTNRWHEYSGWHYVRVQRPGCYVWQIDGRNFSHLVVFRVVPE